MELQTLPFSIGEIGGVAPFHAQERTSLTYPSRFSKQFLILQPQLAMEGSSSAAVVTAFGPHLVTSSPARPV
jgi:hypothetical protein